MKLAVNSYNDMAHVMVSARVMGFSVNHLYDVMLHLVLAQDMMLQCYSFSYNLCYGVSPCYGVCCVLVLSVNHHYSVSPGLGVSPYHGVGPCYGVGLFFGVFGVIPNNVVIC